MTSKVIKNNKEYKELIHSFMIISGKSVLADEIFYSDDETTDSVQAVPLDLTVSSEVSAESEGIYK